MSTPRGYEMRLCPAHKEKNPSFAVNTVTGWGKCFACGHSERVFDGASPPPKPRQLGPQPFHDAFIEQQSKSCHNSLSTELMLERRRISVDTALELGMRAVRLDGIDYIAFVYRDEACRPLYWKLRNTDGSKERMTRYPRGVRSALYNLPELAGLRDDETPIIVEGELDVAALHQAGFRGVVSVPDGAGTPMTDALLAPLRRFKAFRIATDSDTYGEDLSKNLAAALGRSHCTRIHFRGEM